MPYNRVVNNESYDGHPSETKRPIYWRTLASTNQLPWRSEMYACMYVCMYYEYVIIYMYVCMYVCIQTIKFKQELMPHRWLVSLQK